MVIRKMYNIVSRFTAMYVTSHIPLNKNSLFISKAPSSRQLPTIPVSIRFFVVSIPEICFIDSTIQIVIMLWYKRKLSKYNTYISTPILSADRKSINHVLCIFCQNHCSLQFLLKSDKIPIKQGTHHSFIHQNIK